MDAGITLTGVDYGVQGKAILRGITLSLTEARIGIIGRNGSGKTTLLRLMAGLIAPQAGRITVAGLDPSRERKAMLGITDNLVRISVGIEDADDLIADFEQALAAV